MHLGLPCHINSTHFSSGRSQLKWVYVLSVNESHEPIVLSIIQTLRELDWFKALFCDISCKTSPPLLSPGISFPLLPLCKLYMFVSSWKQGLHLPIICPGASTIYLCALRGCQGVSVRHINKTARAVNSQVRLRDTREKGHKFGPRSPFLKQHALTITH